MRTEIPIIRRWCARACVATAGLLAGCALSPGMHADRASMPPIVPIDARTIAAQAAAPADDAWEVLRPLLDGVPGAYRIGAGDVLSITVTKHPELLPPAGPEPDGGRTAGFVVEADGKVRFPLAGGVSVAGLNTDEARVAMVRALSPYFRAPQVTVRVAAFRSQRIHVGGAVRAPGAQVLSDVPTTLALALSQAGGMADTGDASRIWLTRRDRIYRIDLPALAAHGRSPQDLLLRDGDQLRVAERAEHPVFVAGEVGQPRMVPMRDGALSLGEALAQAGSVSQTSADARGVYVVRLNDGQDVPEVFQLDATSPTGLVLAARFPLRPRDLVYVQPAGLVRWNRVMTLLVSSSVSLYNTQRAAGSP